jgi:hypothetical protein
VEVEEIKTGRIYLEILPSFLVMKPPASLKPVRTIKVIEPAMKGHVTEFF